MKAKRPRQTFAFFFLRACFERFHFFSSGLNIVWRARAFSFSSSKQLGNFGSPFHDEFSLLNRPERTSVTFYLKSSLRRVNSKLDIAGRIKFIVAETIRDCNESFVTQF